MNFEFYQQMINEMIFIFVMFNAVKIFNVLTVLSFIGGFFVKRLFVLSVIFLFISISCFLFLIF